MRCKGKTKTGNQCKVKIAKGDYCSRHVKKTQKATKKLQKPKMGKWIIYTINNCKYCVSAKHLLSQRDLPYEIRNVEQNTTFEKEYDLLHLPNSFPQLFYIDSFGSSHYVGNYNQFVKHLC